MDPRKFLNSLFEIAVAKAQPRQCVPPFLSKLDIKDRQRSIGNVKGYPVFLIDLDDYGDQSPDLEPIIYD